MFNFNNWMPDYAQGMQPNHWQQWMRQFQVPFHPQGYGQAPNALMGQQFRQALQQPVKNAMYSTPQNPYPGSGVANNPWGA